MNIYSFKMRNHIWIDNGIGGLYSIAKSDKNRLNQYKIVTRLNDKQNSLEFEYYDLSSLREFLTECYKDLSMRYWNVSTSKQKENPELVLMDRATGELKLGPKRVPTPIAALFVKGSSWKPNGIPYKDLPEKEKKRVKVYLEQTGKSLWGKKEYLLYDLPTCHPEIDILPENYSRRRKQVCCVCGNESSSYREVSQPSYLLFASNTATKSFNSQGKMPDVICWECEFLSKFALHTAGFKKIGKKSEANDILIIQSYSPSVQMLIDLQSEMGADSPLRRLGDDDIYYCNIRLESDSLVRYASKPFELLWSFFYDKFSLLVKEQIKQESQESLEDWLKDNDYNEFFEKISFSPVMFFLIHAEIGSKTFITKDLTIYQDICYFFRLLKYLTENNINPRVFFSSIWDSEDKNPNLVREEICRKILMKQSILSVLEPFCFRKIMNGQLMAFSDILNFAKIYEPIIKKEGVGMNKDQIETAVNLGKQIVLSVLPKDEKDKSKADAAMRKVKGDLFALRKSRTSTDFLNQLTNMMFRYGISVSGKLLDGILEEVKFEDFRAYCIMGALQVINTVNSSSNNISKEDQQ